MWDLYDIFSYFSRDGKISMAACEYNNIPSSLSTKQFLQVNIKMNGGKNDSSQEAGFNT